MKNTILIFLLSLLGFSGCDDSSGNKARVEYGTPTSRFTIKGHVTNAAGNPIKGLRVTPAQAWYLEVKGDKITPSDNKEGIYHNTPAITDQAGYYETQGDCFGYTNFGVELSIEDIDGKENGGDFGKTTAEINLLEKDCTSQDGWVIGYTKQADDLRLTEEK